MRGPIELEVTSELAAPRAEVWATVSTMGGVNQELMPLIRMTHPNRWASLEAAHVVPGEVLFRSWLLAGGVVPIDRHALALQAIDPGQGFVEESTSWLQKRWRHERTLADTPDGGCTVTDRLRVEPRLGLARPVVRAVVGAVFRHRHRQLRRRFG